MKYNTIPTPDLYNHVASCHQSIFHFSFFFGIIRFNPDAHGSLLLRSLSVNDLNLVSTSFKNEADECLPPYS